MGSAEAELGHYKDAEGKANELLSRNPGNRGLHAALGEIELETGRYKEAAEEFKLASAGSDGSSVTVGLRSALGRVRALLAQGKEEEARAGLQEMLRSVDANLRPSAADLTLIAQGLVLVDRFKEANDFFIDAREADPKRVEAYVAQGNLLNQKFAYPDAASLFADALKINPSCAAALVGSAESKQIQSSEAASAAVDLALTVNPN